MNNAIQFLGTVIDRSRGRHGLSAPSAKELMEKVPAWRKYICEITGWDCVELGTLTLKEVRPLPRSKLADVKALGIEPEGLFAKFNPGYACFLKQKRGARRYFGARVFGGERWRIAAVSFQDRPDKEDVLEVYSPQHLRTEFGLQTGDRVKVEVFDRAEWLKL
ncbi:MAG: hypothetical protein OXF33_09010 [Rhodospirillales bacterium]|nr:hypothetical protein [Rhodospirillales bacterium]